MDQELRIDAAELKNKQSVRTTFKLQERTINLIRVSARHLRIKQKTLLDQLLEDKTVLDLLAQDAATYSRNENACRFKTFVVSRRALGKLDEVCSRYQVPRNFIFELSAARLAAYVDSLAETHQARRSLLNKIDGYTGQFDQLLIEAGTLLQENDNFLLKLETLTERLNRQVDEIRKTVKDKSEFVY